MSPKAKIWDNAKQKILFTFKDGEYDTSDEYIIKFWSDRVNPIPNAPSEEARELEKPKRKRRTKEEMRGEA